MTATTIETLGDLLDHGYRYYATCPTCGTREVDLERLIAKYGRDTSYIRPVSPVRVKCSKCGKVTADCMISARR